MKFVAREDAKLLGQRLQREIAACATPRAVLYEHSVTARDHARDAEAIAAAAGRFAEAIVLFQWALRGDGCEEPALSDPDWRRYRIWRSSHQEQRRLYDAPGHLFDGGEAALFAQAIAHGLTLGWDAIVAAKPKRQLILLSHDSGIEIYRGFAGGALTRKLVGAGCWRTLQQR
ncbi:hypothetical protein ACQR1I_29745 [Bradyrhizobium sp. HKCCYLS2038]|uniref:hypothetical protein n=1 Tax=unclassified Bradyrhizobium TaxID=2631580 RepID=UPI003EBF010E